METCDEELLLDTIEDLVRHGRCNNHAQGQAIKNALSVLSGRRRAFWDAMMAQTEIQHLVYGGLRDKASEFGSWISGYDVTKP